MKKISLIFVLLTTSFSICNFIFPQNYAKIEGYLDFDELDDEPLGLPIDKQLASNYYRFFLIYYNRHNHIEKVEYYVNNELSDYWIYKYYNDKRLKKKELYLPNSNTPSEYCIYLYYQNGKREYEAHYGKVGKVYQLYLVGKYYYTNNQIKKEFIYPANDFRRDDPFYWIMKFDRTDNVYKKEYSYLYGEKINKSIWYDRNRQIVQIKNDYNTIKYFYNKNNNPVKVETYEENTLIEYVEMKYNNQGKILSKLYYENNKLVQKSEYTYYADNKTIKEKLISLLNQEKHQELYDKNGNILLEKHFENNELSKIVHYQKGLINRVEEFSGKYLKKIVYYEDGKITREDVFFGGSLHYILYRINKGAKEIYKKVIYNNGKIVDVVFLDTNYNNLSDINNFEEKDTEYNIVYYLSKVDRFKYSGKISVYKADDKQSYYRVFYDKKNMIVREEKYKNGALESYLVFEYWDNDKLKSIEEYNSLDKKHNHSYEYDSSGNLILISRYKDGYAFGKWFYKNAQGKIIKTEYYRLGSLIEYWIYYYGMNGKLEREENYENGKLTEIKIYNS